MNLKRAAANGLVVLLSMIVALALCEAGARLVLSPADYLSPTMVPDDVLGMRIAPESAGMDAWGFRNRMVPETVDVITVGDSHTFGNTATMNDSWPSVLGRATGLSVYNLALGGYGPNQYYHLLTTRGLSLHPKWVLCGVYMGDDFENAFSITYGLDYWAFLRSGRWRNINANIWNDSAPRDSFRVVRNWLSRTSLTYRLAVHGPVLGALKARLQFAQARRNHDPSVTELVDEEQNIREAFRPVGMASRLDQSRSEIKEGMRITFHLLREMDRICRQHACTLAVVIIPTKETVFAQHWRRAQTVHLEYAVDNVIAGEQLARQELGRFLDQSGILYVDTLPALRQAVGGELYARTTADMHPSRNGYRVIADAVTEFLRRSTLGNH